MKYYIKHTSTRTGATMVMRSPVFTSKASAQEYARKLVKLISNARLEVVTSK